MGEILQKDREIYFPHFTVIKASAGSGKTRTLTKRFVQFILSEEIRYNRLRNVLAITFSNNASREMKERILLWLKLIYFRSPADLSELSKILSISEEKIIDKAGRLIDEILDNYSDFQVKTIDSFMATVFKTAAIDFGYNPDFEVLMTTDSLMEYSFELFMRNVREGTPEAAFLGDIIDFLLEQKRVGESYLWDPSNALLEEIKKIYRKLASAGKKPRVEDYSTGISKMKEQISACVEKIEKEIERSGLKRHGNSSYKTILPLVRGKSFADLIDKRFANPPVSRFQKGNSRDEAAYERILSLWRDTEKLIDQFTVMFVRSRCMPYIEAFESLSETVETVKRQQGKVFIEDINLLLAGYLDTAVVPDVYFRIGETIFHFLIDEFQDTSPVQWRNLLPLIENSLSQGGSLLSVGDTKQAIYGFRDADYAIMKGLETNNPFPSAEHMVRELSTNYRSRKRILEFNERVFKDNLARNEQYREAGKRSGLTEYVQNPKEGEDDEGYAEIVLLERNDDEPPERGKVQELIGELVNRGYNFSDIAVLTQTNEDAVNVTTWLNEKNIDFISYSSLDVRRRQITGEIVALMNFLDSPTDDLSFGTFILGNVFTKAIAREYPDIDIRRLREFCFLHRSNPPLYKAFQGTFGHLWARYFERLFKAAGFLPVYDLLTEVLALFRVFENLPDEEAALVKILEVVKEFEGGGFNSIKGFLSTALDGEDGKEWEMAVPAKTDAIKVMTIHKAKGLGFPVVIVLLYEVANRGLDYIVEDNGDKLCLLKLSKRAAARDEALQKLYDQERMKEMVNRLNSLYVGFTRPERELYVVGVESRDAAFPFVLLPGDEFTPSAHVSKMTEGRPAGSFTFASLSLLHRHRQLTFSAGSEVSMKIEEKRRGNFIHKVLSYINYINEGIDTNIKEGVKRAREATGADYSDEEIEARIKRVLDNPEMGRYFREAYGREIRKEQEYSDGDGRLFRMDRVVIDPDGVTVIDYKTGSEKEALEKYKSQIRNYMKILAEVYPGKAVRGVIAFVDLGEVEKMQ